MSNEALNKLTKARATLILDHPFFGELAMRLKLIDGEGLVTAMGPLKTMAVDGKHLYYDTDFVLKLSMKHLLFVLAHEVMHCVWDHLTRISGRDPRKWGVATDLVINNYLKNYKDKSGQRPFEMPSMGLWSKEFSGPQWSADAVYNKLPDSSGTDGSSGLGEALDILIPGPVGQQDRASQNQMSREWKIATIQAANSAKLQGHMTADLERFLNELMKPQVNWVEKLRNFFTSIARDDYNWTRPNKRFEDVYMPSLYNEVMGEIVVVVDDSGSISNKMLNVFGAEIKAIMEDMRPRKTHLIFCDSSVKRHYELDPEDTLPLKIHGGGGTDFRPPFELVEEKEINPMCLVYLTDLQGPAGKYPPDYPVMWVSVTDELEGPWGETLHIDANGM